MRPLPSPQFQGHRRAVLLAAAELTGEAAIAELCDLAPAVDWEAAAGLALRLGVGPLLHHAVRRAGLSVPEPVRRRLQAAYVLAAIRNEAIMAEVLRVTSALDGAGIPSMPLKGASLIATVYPDPALRTLSDIDLLVPPERERQAERVLVRMGYELADEGLLLESSRRFNHHVVLRPTGGGVRPALELHFGLLSRFGPHHAAQGVWERCRRVPYGVGSVLALSREDEVVFLAGHFMVHLFHPQLKWLVDLARIVEQGGIEWRVLASRARETRETIAVHEALWRAQELLGAPVPARALVEIRGHPAAHALLRRLAPLGLSLGEPPLARWHEQVAALLMAERPSDSLRWAVLAALRKLWAWRAQRERRRDDG